MLALYRAGRQAEALDAYQRARTLVDGGYRAGPGAAAARGPSSITTRRDRLPGGRGGLIGTPSIARCAPPFTGVRWRPHRRFFLLSATAARPFLPTRSVCSMQRRQARRARCCRLETCSDRPTGARAVAVGVANAHIKPWIDDDAETSGPSSARRLRPGRNRLRLGLRSTGMPRAPAHDPTSAACEKIPLPLAAGHFPPA